MKGKRKQSMDKNIEQLVNQVISFIDEKGDIVKDYLKNNEIRLKENELTTGTIQKIDITWKYKECAEEQGMKLFGTITFVSETSALAIRDVCKALESDLKFTQELEAGCDVSFLESSSIKEDVSPALKEYLQKVVDNETYGGFYDNWLTLNLKISLNNEVLNKTTNNLIQIVVVDEKRNEQQKQKIHDLIARETYQNIDVEQSYDLLPEIIRCAVEDFHDEFGNEQLMKFFNGMITESEEDIYIYKAQLMRGFAEVQNNLLGLRTGVWHTDLSSVGSNKENIPSEEKLSLASDIAMLLLMRGSDNSDKKIGEKSLKIAKKLGSQKANDILRFGTGKIPKEIIYYKDKNVTCSANDIEGIIGLKIKNENEEAYRSIILYIINLIKHDFLNEYRIKTKFNKEEYSSATEYFWSQCAEYPSLWPLMKEYVEVNDDRYSYYNDDTDEYSVPVGGYAMFALGRASEENKDIVESFIDNCDEEHAVSVREYAGEYINQYGLNKDNIPVITICLQKARSKEGYSKVIESLEDIELLKAFVAYMEERSDEGEDEIYISEIIERLWEDEDSLREFMEEKSSEYKLYYEKILELAERY